MAKVFDEEGEWRKRIMGSYIVRWKFPSDIKKPSQSVELDEENCLFRLRGGSLRIGVYDCLRKQWSLVGGNSPDLITWYSDYREIKGSSLFRLGVKSDIDMELSADDEEQLKIAIMAQKVL